VNVLRASSRSIAGPGASHVKPAYCVYLLVKALDLWLDYRGQRDINDIIL